MSSVSARTTTVTTVAEQKPDRSVIDDVPLGEKDAKSGKLKASNIARRGIAKKEAENPTDSVPKRQAVFDGGGTPAVAFPPTTDVVAIREGSDIPEALQAELRAKDRALSVLREQREEARKAEEADLAKYEAELRRLERQKDALEAKLTEKNRQLTKLNTSNEDLRRELEETKEKLANTEANAKEKFLEWEPESNVGLAYLCDGEFSEDAERRLTRMKDIVSILPELSDWSFAVAKIKPKKASSWWYFGFPAFKLLFDECLHRRRGVLHNDTIHTKKIGLSDFNACYALEPIAMHACITDNPDGGRIVKKGNDRYSVKTRKGSRMCRLFSCRKKRKVAEIRKLMHAEVAVDIVPEETRNLVKIPEPFDVSSSDEKTVFEQKETVIGNESRTPLPNECRNSEAESERNSGNRRKTVSEGSSKFMSFDDNDGLFVVSLVRRFNKWYWGE